MTRVSVAMATYNGAEYLAEQLDSLAKQSRLPDELVISDDASRDRTVEIAQHFAAKAPFPVVIHNNPHNLGYSQNFGQAMSRCSGELIFLADQDDIWFPNKIARVMERFESRPDILMAVNDQEVVPAHGARTGTTIFGNARRAGFADTYLSPGSCTAFVEPMRALILPIPSDIPYDSWIGAIADALGAKSLIEEPLQLFRRHGSNASDPDVVRSTSRLRELMKYRRSDPLPAWRGEIVWRSAMNARLADAASPLRDRVGSARIAGAIASNAHRIQALEARCALLEIPRWRRVVAIPKAISAGLYKNFSGLSSAARDLTRP